jgi:hypothetical protein
VTAEFEFGLDTVAPVTDDESGQLLAGDQAIRNTVEEAVLAESVGIDSFDLLTRLLRDQPVTWSGTVRSPLTDQRVSPPIPAGHIPTWVGVGGSPQPVIRAARYGLPLFAADGDDRALRP